MIAYEQYLEQIPTGSTLEPVHRTSRPPQLEVRQSKRTVEWEIKARPYNTTIANGMFWFMMSIALGACYLMFFKNDNSPLIENCPGAQCFFLFSFSSIWHNSSKTKFVYRLTETGIEVCEWKAPSKGWMIALKWLTGIAAIAVIFVVALDPSTFWVALVGPGGMGLLYLGLVNSKHFQEMHTLYRHNVFAWVEIKHIYIDKSRHLISLEYEWINENINKKLPWWTYIFCQKKF